MQFSTIAILLAAMSAGVFADLHTSAICVSTDSGENVYEEAITTTACTYYSNRDTGDEWWDTCPDCVILTEPIKVDADIPYCSSAAGHIGGDEISYYCKLAGADGSLAT
ncbi:MAG: hypothetical protein M1834_005429 [Cirrosporium novae-zelandiae]|nr:MAG: hypothetical protein M1834_005429 [Cirrosporium novae-zelandiae]